MGDGTRKILIGKPKETRPRGKLKIRWEDKDLKDVDYEGDWKTLSQVRVKCHACILVAMNLRVP